MNFPDWLLSEMKKREWTNADLAKKAGLSRQAVGYYLEGRTPSNDACKKIARAFGVTPDIVFRHVGILPKENERDEWIRRVEHKLSQIESEEDRRLVEGLIELLSPSRKKTVRRHSEQ